MPEALALDEHEEAFRLALCHLLTSSAPEILRRFEATLASVDSPLLANEVTRTQVLAHAQDIVDKTAQEIAGRRVPDMRFSLPQEIGASRANSGTHPNESLRAADLLFGVVISHVAERLGGGPSARQVALTAVTLHDVLARSLRLAADSYVRVLLNRVHEAQVEERRRISRELHDRIGHGIGVVQRDLELFEIYRIAEPDRALARIQAARRVLTESLDAVREAINDLRLSEPMENLELALKLFLEESAGPELVRQVEVNGDEAWAPTETIEQVFLIAREALRNTITHAHAEHVSVRIDISPGELWASIVDDGQGVESGHLVGTGVLSMRERAALLGGSLILRSAPGLGTQVELRVPLNGDPRNNRSLDMGPR